MPLKHAALALLLTGLAGCAGRSTTALPNPEVLAAHEWEHGPPWGPEEIPWVSPPPSYYSYYDPAPWYWGGASVGLRARRGPWWGGHRGFHRGRSGLIGRGGWHGGRGPMGGHFGGRRGRR